MVGVILSTDRDVLSVEFFHSGNASKKRFQERARELES